MFMCECKRVEADCIGRPEWEREGLVVVAFLLLLLLSFVRNAMFIEDRISIGRYRSLVVFIREITFFF